MPITRERFEQGMTYDQYKAQMSMNQERFADTEQHLSFSAAELKFFTDLPQPINVLVLTEDWCGDAMTNVPVVGKLAEETSRLNVRIFLRDQNLDIMDQYLKAGQYRSIPVFVFFDQDFRELGHFIERPESVTEIRDTELGKLYSDPLFADIAPNTAPGDMPEAARNRLYQVFGAFRASNRAFMDSEVVREIRELIQQGQASGSQIEA